LVLYSYSYSYSYFTYPVRCVADEVESYPCPLCPERVFLTSFGLERHSAEKHPGHIIDHIETISSEWRRREEELARRRDRMYSSRVRQENIARHGSADPNEPLKERRYKSCNSCGMLIDAESSAAMESHMRAHKKNDDLKRKLLARYGPEEVNRLMCRDCNMVFCDDNSLLAHNDQMHTRRRKYVCKWCGHVSHTMTELNVHKADVHAMPPYTMKSDRDRVRYFQKLTVIQSLRLFHLSLVEILPNFRTTCEQCGLRLVRPSLLVRHMLRVHSKSSFSCEVSVWGTKI
uniref:C2H2-type domain-containing protein n=1 Tax=Nippostrongylus brasiliensis TaxID=27835 RepID=A0A0N4XG55_NIPBR